MNPHAGTFCSLELTRQWYAQRIDAIGPHRDIPVVIKNVGNTTCDGGVKFAVVT
ncbi:MAG TPA: hypothetical protein VLM05_01260 [Mycobacteriales bacterium]|nr:hypothetical protein [Mycobacteriales bacterium]